MEDTKRCPYCGEEILAIAKKCKHCGEWLTQQDENPQEKKMTICPICAEQVEIGTKVCPYCHEKLMEDNQSVLQAEQSLSESSPVSCEPTRTEVKAETVSARTDFIGEHVQGFFEYYFVDTFIRHYADFKGKISRKQFWLSYLCYALFIILLLCIDLAIGSPFIVTALGTIALMIPGIAFVVRRLHDIGKSGWWIFVYCVPLIGVIWWIVLMCKKGETKALPVKHGTKDFIVWGVGILLIILSVVLGMNRNSTGVSAHDSDIHETAGQKEPELWNYCGNIGRYVIVLTLYVENTTKNTKSVHGFYYDLRCGDTEGCQVALRGTYNSATDELLLEETEDGGRISAVKVPQGIRGTYTTSYGDDMDFFVTPVYD